VDKYIVVATQCRGTDRQAHYLSHFLGLSGRCEGQSPLAEGRNKVLTRATVGFVRRLSAGAAPNLGDNSGMPSAIGGPHRARIIALESVMLIRSGFTMDFGVRRCERSWECKPLASPGILALTRQERNVYFSRPGATHVVWDYA
jgi:hypothetical protein